MYIIYILYTYIHTRQGLRLYTGRYIISLFLSSWQMVSPVVRSEERGWRQEGKLTARAYRFRLLQNDKKRIENQTIR